MPESLARTDGWRSFERLSNRVNEAMKAGTFDARDDSCLAWSLIQLDRRGWEKVNGEFDALFGLALEERDRAAARMRESGEEPIRMTLVLGAFESPRDSAEEA